MKKLLLFSSFALLLLSAFLGWKLLRAPLSDEQQIARHMDGIITGANNRSVGAIAGFLSPHFDFKGTNKRELRSQLTGAVLSYRGVDLQISDVVLRVYGNRATSTGRYTLQLKSEFSSPPEVLRGDFFLQWSREDGQWKVLSARGTP